MSRLGQLGYDVHSFLLDSERCSPKWKHTCSVGPDAHPDPSGVNTKQATSGRWRIFPLPAGSQVEAA